MGTSSVEPSTALATIQTITATDLFKPGAIDMILERIEREAREQAASLEISTEVSRQAIASLAYKIARSKTYIDDRGKDLGESLRTQLEAINSERKRARERLDLLKDEVRKPLTDWENLDKARQAAHERELTGIEKAGVESLRPLAEHSLPKPCGTGSKRLNPILGHGRSSRSGPRESRPWRKPRYLMRSKGARSGMPSRLSLRGYAPRKQSGPSRSGNRLPHALRPTRQRREQGKQPRPPSEPHRPN